MPPRPSRRRRRRYALLAPVTYRLIKCTQIFLTMKQLRIVIRCFLVSKLSFDADARRRREFITPPPASPNSPNPAFINNASSRFKGENFIRTAKLIACTVAVAWTTALPLPPIPCIEIGGSAHAASILSVR